MWSLALLNEFNKFLESLSVDVYSERPSDTHNVIIKRMVPWVAAKTGIPKEALILDVGAGYGAALDAFAGLGFLNRVGINFSKEDFEAVREAGHKSWMLDMHAVGTVVDSADLIWCRHCAEHSPVPLFLLHQFKKALRSGGWLYLEVPAPNTICYHESNPNHYSIFDFPAWAELLKKAGFVVVETKEIPLNVPAGPDIYFWFLARKKA